MTSDERILALIQGSRRGEDTDDGTITTRELAKLMGCALSTARERMRELVEAGHLESARSVRPNVTGQPQQVWAYRVVEGA